MRTTIGHLVYSIRPQNQVFYRDLFSYMGWATLVDMEGMLGLGADNGQSIWFGTATKDSANDYDAPGLNHLAIAAESIADVDEAAAWLSERGIAMLFGTPQHRPDFSSDDASTYYQIMFESPDRLLFEIVYTGPK